MKFTKLKNAVLFTLIAALLCCAVVLGALFATDKNKDNLEANAATVVRPNIGSLNKGGASSLGSWDVDVLSKLILNISANTSYASLINNSNIKIVSFIICMGL